MPDLAYRAIDDERGIWNVRVMLIHEADRPTDEMRIKEFQKDAGSLDDMIPRSYKTQDQRLKKLDPFGHEYEQKE